MYNMMSYDCSFVSDVCHSIGTSIVAHCYYITLLYHILEKGRHSSSPLPSLTENVLVISTSIYHKLPFSVTIRVLRVKNKCINVDTLPNK